MKKSILILIMALVPSLLMAQAAGGTIARPAKKQSKMRFPKENLSEAKKAIIDNILGNMILVAGGTYTMGATQEQASFASDDEYPAHQVTIESFYICKYEVTQEEWEAVMGNNPSLVKGGKLPVENVSWEDCQRFIKRLNTLTNGIFRLPTEAEWEFAARGGNYSRGYKYSGSNNIDEVAWYKENSDMTIHEVGTKLCNEIGIYDMSGNVWEWCQDWYKSNYYKYSPNNNPSGPNTASARIFRGGSYKNFQTDCRLSNRNGFGQRGKDDNYGLRLAY